MIWLCKWCGGTEQHNRQPCWAKVSHKVKPGLNVKRNSDDKRSARMRAFNSDTKHQSAAAAAVGPSRRGTGSTDWYIKEGGRHQHRVVVERILRRPLRVGEVVHHEDKNKKNNTPENLIVFVSQADHVRHHNSCYGGEDCSCLCIRFN